MTHRPPITLKLFASQPAYWVSEPTPGRPAPAATTGTMASSSVSLRALRDDEHGGRGVVPDPTGAGAEHHARQPPVAVRADDQEVDAIAVAGRAVHHRGLGKASTVTWAPAASAARASVSAARSCIVSTVIA